MLPDFGMNMISLRRNGKPVLREPESMELLQQSPYVYGIPLLFPANRTEGGQFTFEGKTYSLPLNEPERGNHIHGLLYDAPFRVTEQSLDFVRAVFENTGERYPFPFRMTISDKLSEIGLTRTLMLENTGRGDLPFTLAFHTTFVEPVCFAVPVKDRLLCNPFYIPTGEHAALTPEEQEYLTGVESQGRRISGFYTAAAQTARIEDVCFTVSKNFDTWVLFNGGGTSGFLCVEPQCGEVNGLNTPQGHRVLHPGETKTFVISISKGNEL